MAHHREEFLHQYCDDCAKPANHQGCGSKFKQIFEPVRCPAILESSHDVCPFCLDLFAKKYRHNQFCLFTKHKVQLHVAGWATPASTQVLRSLRQAKCPYTIPLSNLITELFTELNLRNVKVVPIPLGNTAARKQWREIIANAVCSLEGNEVVPAINREKQHSTRKSVAQIRYKIAREEYQLSKDYADSLKDRRVVLIDDNVTTGNTIVRCAEMLLECNPSEVFLLTLDRTIGPRALQRCDIPSELHCPYKISITTESDN